MDTLYFYINPDSIDQNLFTLGKDESHHLLRVLRKPIGTEIMLIDGNGTAYQAKTESVTGNRLQGTLLEKYPNYGENKTRVHLAIGILKGDRLKLAIEKATEMGVNSISLLTLDHCIKREAKLDRLKKIVVSSVKQCGRSFIPELQSFPSMDEWIKRTKNEERIVCALDENTLLSNIREKQIKEVEDIHIVIGPEGDFSQREMDMMKENALTIISLGPRRLRSETAVVTVLAIVNELMNSE